MISLPHTPTNYEISARSILLKFLISTHACLFIHTASYTIIRSILSGTYKNVPPYTLVRAYTDTEFLYICHSIPLFHLHCYLELWSNYFSLCTKKHLQNYTWVPYDNLQNFSLHLDLKIYWNSTHSLDMTSWPMKFKINFVNPHLRLL